MADTYSSRALLTGRELRRIRQRALDASPIHQRRVASTSATLRSRFTSADPARQCVVTRDAFASVVRAMNPAVDNGVVRELARRYASGDGIDYAAFASALAADSALHAHLQKPRRLQDNGDIVFGRDEPRGAEIAAEQRAVCQDTCRALAAAGGGGDELTTPQTAKLLRSLRKEQLLPAEAEALASALCGGEGGAIERERLVATVSEEVAVPQLLIDKRWRDHGNITAWPEGAATPSRPPTTPLLEPRSGASPARRPSPPAAGTSPARKPMMAAAGCASARQQTHADTYPYLPTSRARRTASRVPAAGRRGASWRHESGTMPAPLAPAATAKALEAAARPPARVLSPSTKPPRRAASE